MQARRGRWRPMYAALFAVLGGPVAAQCAIELERGVALVDLTRDDVQFHVSPGADGESATAVAGAQDWRPIRLGAALGAHRTS